MKLFQKVISENGTFIDTVTVSGILKNNEAINKWFHMVDSIMYRDQILMQYEKTTFKPFQKAGGIYIIVPSPNK